MKKINFRMNDYMHMQIKNMAEYNHLSMQAMLTELVQLGYLVKIKEETKDGIGELKGEI